MDPRDYQDTVAKNPRVVMEQVNKEDLVLVQHLDPAVRAALDLTVTWERQVDLDLVLAHMKVTALEDNMDQAETKSMDLEVSMELKKTLDTVRRIKTLKLYLPEADVDPVVDPVELANPGEQRSAKTGRANGISKPSNDLRISKQANLIES